jgi:membrane protease YdiL (CAAX protease family)
MLIAQPLGEELVFRGVVQPVFRTILSAWPGLLVTALVYGLFHQLAYPPAYADISSQTALWYGLALPALQGVIFGMNRAVTGSTRAAIFAHAAFGLFALLKVFIIVR